ncbi:hypothetical protein [Arthrobacter sp. D1-17]
MTTFQPRTSLTDPASPVFGTVSTAVIGALALVDPAKLTTAQRRTLRTATAALTGLYTAATVNRTRPVLAPLNAAAGIAAAALVLRFADANDALESRMVHWLSSAGISRPRRWLAAGSAALTFAMFLADRATARKEERESVALDALTQVRPLTPAVGELTRAILSAADVSGADALLAQLEQAEEIYWDEDFVPAAQFQIPDDVPRAVPQIQVFPVTARYEAETGAPLQVMLHIYDGKLEHLAIDTVGETDELVEDQLDRWPNPDEVQYVIDGPDGTPLPIRPNPQAPA